MKRLRLFIPVVVLLLVLFAVGCSSESPVSPVSPVLSEAELAYNEGLIRSDAFYYEAAIKHFGKAVELAPDFADAYFGRAFANTRLFSITAIPRVPMNVADYDSATQRALADYNKAIELDPDNAKFYLFRSFVLRDLGKDTLAEKDFDKSCELDKSQLEC